MKNGPYELITAPSEYPGKKYRGRYIYEHHLVWWQQTGKPVPSRFDIHHKNGEKRDNKFENLELIAHSEHASEHGQERSLETRKEATCFYCGETFYVKGNQYRARKKQNRSGRLFCGRSHQVKQQWLDNPNRFNK